MAETFELLAQDRQAKARHGRLTTAHGVIETPAFMPVGTQGSVKAARTRCHSPFWWIAQIHELEWTDLN
jgi:queuine tRNA-ribosyltransferase